MKLLMAGVNFKNNNIEEREKLSFSNEEIIKICKRVCKKEGINGCILLATCNRTEIYLSCDKDAFFQADRLLLESADISGFSGEFEKNEDLDLVYHIIKLACGLKSQILGEEQIAAQINQGLKLSMENGCTDSVLDTLFRIAVSAGKAALANVKISSVPISAAYGAVRLLSEKSGGLKGRKAVIVGNGKMSKIIQASLINEGCKVYVTLREYKRGNSETAKGCRTIRYSERYKYFEESDFVVSATKSPHFTITADKFSKLNKKPLILIDLAVPRDIEPEINKMCRLFNIDELGFESKIDDKSLNMIYDIVEKYVSDFIMWKNYKMSLSYIDDIKDVIAKRIIKSKPQDEKISNEYTQRVVFHTVGKTVDMLLGSMKNKIEPYAMEECRRKIEERARL